MTKDVRDELPDDYVVQFNKDYEYWGNKFTVGVQYRGNDGVRHTWMSTVEVGKTLLQVGPFHWDVNDRKLTNEDVCNQLATFWGKSDTVTSAQYLVQKPMLTGQMIVQKCADLMFKDSFFGGNKSDYDILLSNFTEFGWDVVLMPNHEPERLYIFSTMGTQAHVKMWVYMRAYARKYAPFTV